MFDIQDGFCVNSGVCFENGETLGCFKCHTDNEQTQWIKDIVPDIHTVTPAIKAEIHMLNDSVGEVEFFCDFNAPNRSLIYFVEWGLSDGTTMHNASGIPDDDDTFRNTTKLTETHLRQSGIHSFGFTINCSVKAKASEEGSFSDVYFSENTFFGIKVLPESGLNVEHAQQSPFTVQLTVPFACPKKKSNCPIDLSIFIPNNSNARSCEISSIALIHSPCGVRLTNSDIGITKTLFVKNKHPNVLNKLTQMFEVFLKTSHLRSHAMISNYNLTPLQVSVSTDNSILSGRRCFAYSDPHMMSFDGSKYEHQYLGKFLMYRNVKFNTSVEIVTDKCPNYSPRLKRPFCSVAVAVQAGRDVFVINLKENVVGMQHCEDGILANNVKREGKVFHINLPTGTKVTLSTSSYGRFIETYILPGMDDLGNTEGLCGSFDGNPGNDFVKPDECKEVFGICWSVDADGSIIDLFNNSQLVDLPAWDKEELLCTCECDGTNQSAECYAGNLSNVLTCDSNSTKTCHTDNLKDMSNDLCKEGSKAYNSWNVISSQMPYPHTGQQQTVEFDELTAIHECKQKMNTPLLELCANLQSIDMGPYLNNCVQDALMSNSMEWTQVHIEEFKRHCLDVVSFNQPIPDHLLSNLVLNVPGVQGNNPNPVAVTTVPSENTILHGMTNDAHFRLNTSEIFNGTLLKTIRDMTCPNDCSGQGMCETGICQCFEGFFDSDCSEDVSKPPTLMGVSGEGLCDLKIRDCSKTAVIGRTFVESRKLTCSLVPFEVDTENNTVYHGIRTVQGKLDSFLQVFCNFPQAARIRRSFTDENVDNIVATGYTVAVSNNGVDFSENDTVVIFDSTCVSCIKLKGEVNCVKKESFCVNSGVCFENGETLGCFKCHTDNVQAQWIKVNDCSKTKPSSTAADKDWIAGVVLGSFFLVACAAVTCWVIKRKRGMMHIKYLGTESRGYYSVDKPSSPVTSSQVDLTVGVTK